MKVEASLKGEQYFKAELEPKEKMENDLWALKDVMQKHFNMKEMKAKK